MTDPVTVVPSRRMSNVDAAWLGMDSPDNLMMVTAVLRLDRPVDRERLRDVLAHRLVERYPKFRLRPLPSGSPFEQPVWADDPEFTLDRHLVDAGRVADDGGLGAVVSRLLSTPLDMRHSPWQFHVVSGLATVDGRAASALVVRLHHCIADGIALASVLLSLTDDEAVVGQAAADVAGRDPRRPGIRTRLTAGSHDLVPVAGVDPLAPRSLRQAVDAVVFGWRVLSTGVGLLLATRDPRTRLAGRLGTDKVAAWSRPLDLGVVKRVAAALDATVNDVLLAVTAGALRRHLAAHGEVPHDLRVFVPVDLRPRGEPVPATLGNRFGIVFVKLPLSVADPVARVRAVHDRMAAVKAGAQAASTFAILAVVGALLVLGAPPGSAGARRQVDGHRHQRARADGTRLPGRCPAGAPDVLGAAGRLGRAGCEHPELRRGRDDRRGRGPQPGARPAGAGRGGGGRAGRPGAGHAGCPRRRRTARRSAVRLRARAVAGRRGPAGVRRRYGGQDETPIDPAEFAPPDGSFLVARVGGTPIGCAGMRRHGDGTVEVKRMFVRVEHRRRGHARRLLAALEDRARAQGCRRVVLETGLAQPEAIALYESAGYTPIAGFGHYKDAPLSRSFARDL